MTKIKIVTDSSITIEPQIVEDLEITIVPLSVMVDGVVYSDADLKEGEFLRLMQSSKNLPKTSQPPVGVFAEVFERLGEHADKIISIHMSHALSGTVEAARQGATLSNVDVTVIDSSFTDQALKFQVVEAAKLAKAGADLEDVLAKIEEVREKTELYIGVSTLENLVKGGRIGRVTGLLSSLLNIRVVMQMKQHELQPIVKGRGVKTFKKWVNDLAVSLKDKKVAEIGISYAGTAELANEMKQILQPCVEKTISVLETGSIIQTHTGENAWAILVRYE
ncbi:DegV family protein [Streptococcus constellatus subsp. pharyngis]|uniref:DegV family protein n=1 Tax=Streptococcus constellatus subsp. pharyngis SK1060 = CCUG 46377 TaxID=1035184 RepID=U2ZJ12_STRCV|nr:DegV family protein [Streptococcus constellatus]AGU73227.1 putative DegV family protein [Streptococcus constellatus subsp. pharyngis C232]AGU74981.1 putative DegV family protein [Streptococcus constellatus subsp. pharyngis C818]AGU80372.1 putative DegV family protein [Streptococcus constellatus subsp. pharyngis C1050]QQC22838.1 DegV family protein [Streptococcus constellatus]QRP80906.1 DegV family protein [Streptococcus constellatus]